MNRSLLLLLPLALTACSGGTDAKATDDTGAPACEVTIDETIPSQGAVNADYRAAIEFSLSDADSTAVASSDIPGTSTLSDDNQTVIFTPDSPLSPSTPYTVTLDYCGGSADLGFTTSAVGSPVADASTSLAGRTYGLDLANARIVEPAGIGSVLTSYLTQQILVGVASVDGTQIQMLGAVGADGSDPVTQNYCDPSIDFPVADFSENPFFQIGPQTTTLSVAGYNIDIGDLEITGSFAPDGTYISGATLAGTIDTRPLAPLLDDSGNEGAICDLAVNFGATCEACSSDGQPYCLTLVADEITATEVEDTTLVTVTEQDCTGCESGPPAPDAVCPDPGAP